MVEQWKIACHSLRHCQSQKSKVNSYFPNLYSTQLLWELRGRMSEGEKRGENPRGLNDFGLMPACFLLSWYLVSLFPHNHPGSIVLYFAQISSGLKMSENSSIFQLLFQLQNCLFCRVCLLCLNVTEIAESLSLDLNIIFTDKDSEASW